MQIIITQCTSSSVGFSWQDNLTLTVELLIFSPLKIYSPILYSTNMAGYSIVQPNKAQNHAYFEPI